MIRLFGPPTSDALLGRNALTAGNLLLHLLVLVLLALPMGRVVKESLFDRLVVFLVPPDSPGTGRQNSGEASLGSTAQPEGFRQATAKPEATDPEIAPRGDVPTLNAVELATISQPTTQYRALTQLEVDSAVVRDPNSAAPEYPPSLLSKGIEGSAAVLYVVDTVGVVDTLSYRVVATTNSEFAVAVRRALPAMRFRPAIQAGHKVAQLVEQTFRFQITRRDTVRTPPDPSSLSPAPYQL